MKVLTRKEIARKVLRILNQLYPEPPIPLKHVDNYSLLVAVLLSAQCTDVRVNQVTPALFARASTPQEMIQLSVEEIEQLIRTCGLGPRKARAIWELSHLLLEKYQGKVPDNYEDLESLPGVGHKTASVVMSQAFHHPAFPVDTHIHRLACRWGLSSGKNVEQTEKDLKALFPKKTWNRLHLQMIYFGREYCQARRHDQSLCPICSWISSSSGGINRLGLDL
jgi:endonuclease III